MLKSKAVEIIKTFSSDELKEFGAFISSGYFNTNKNLVRLYKVIFKNHSKLSSENITEEFLYTKIFPAKKYNYGIMKNLMSELAKLTDKFLIINRNNKEIDDTRQRTLLLNEYGRRGLESYFKNLSDKLEKGLKESKISEEYYEDSYIVNEEIRNFYQDRSDIKNYYNTVLTKGESVLSYVISILSDSAVIKFNLEHSYNKTPELDFVGSLIENVRIESLIDFFEKNNIANKADVIIKLKTILLVINDNEDEMYYKVRNEVYNHPGLYTNKMLYTIFQNTLLSYAEKRASQGSNEFFAEKYNLMKKMFSMVKMNSDGVGHLFHSIYLDFILSSIKLGELDYAEWFTGNFAKHVDPTMRDVVEHLGMAYIHSAKGDYEASLAELALTGQADFIIKLRTKFHYLKCYFELKAYEQGFSMIDSFKKFITDTKELHPDFRKSLVDTCNSYNQLFKISASPEDYSAEKLNKQMEIVRKSGILSKEWHLNKLEELRSVIVNK